MQTNKTFSFTIHRSFYEQHDLTDLIPLENTLATLTNSNITGTSINGPMTAAKATPELMPKTAIATAMANSKLLLAAVKDNVTDLP